MALTFERDYVIFNISIICVLSIGIKAYLIDLFYFGASFGAN